MKRLIPLLAVCFACAVNLQAETPKSPQGFTPPPPDSISFSNVFARDFPGSDQVYFHVNALYRLKTLEVAHIRLLANLDSENKYTIFDEAIISNGGGSISLDPTLLKSQIPTTHILKLRIELLSDATESATLLMDDTRMAAEIGSIDFQPDKLELIGFTPQSIAKGETVEVVALLRYRLFTCETATVHAGHDAEHAGSFIMSDSLEIEKGEGEISIPIEVDTSTLGDRIQVLLMIHFKDPKTRYSYSPLATQHIVVPVD